MTQKSYPWGRGLGADSLVGYTAKEFCTLFGLLARAGAVVTDGGPHTLSTLYNLGVFYSVDNKFEVTNPGANEISVSTGVALVEGTLFYGNSIINAVGNITQPVASSRVDRVVVRKNYSAVAYVPAAASAALFTVPAYTSRVTIIHGAEGGGAPALTQDLNRSTYWDIPLASYSIATTGVISILTDEREWVDAIERTVFLPFVGGDNNSSSGFELQSGVLNQAWTHFRVPSDFISGVSVSPVIVSFPMGAGGNIVCDLFLNSEANGQVSPTHQDSSQNVVEAIGTGAVRYVLSGLETSHILSAGDYTMIFFDRQGAHMSNTYASSIYAQGVDYTYMAWR